MKVDLTHEQLAAHDAATLRGGIEGAAVGAAIALPASYIAYKRFPAYRALPPSLKALGVIVCVVPAFAIQSERRGIEYDRSQWDQRDVNLQILESHEEQAERRWEKLSLRGKIGDWASRHEYSVILGGWAAGLGIAGAVISRDKLQSTSQKVVQARMWAQALTIGLIIGAAAFKAHRATNQAPVIDHSWREILEQQERERQADQEHLKQVLPESESRQVAH